MARRMPRIVILTALPVEYRAVRAHLKKLKEEVHPKGTVYEKGLFSIGRSSLQVAIGQIGVGNEAAALETERAIQHFQPDMILFVGVAGGVKDVELDDVVVATKVYQYEAGKAKDKFLPRPDAFTSAYGLTQRAQADAKKDKWLQRIRRSLPTSSRQPNVLVGPIAAGEKVVASIRAQVYRFVKLHYSDALAVEMEGHGFLKAAHANQKIDALVVRGVSDLIKGKKASDDLIHQEIAAQNASAFAFEVLANIALPDAIKPRPKPARQLLYELILTDDEQQRLGVLYSWRLFELPVPNAIRAREGILGTGTTHTTTFHRAPASETADCSVEFEMRIIDNDDDTSRWAGIRVRGFHDDIRFGYLVYMRSTGTVELYRAGEVLEGANKRVVTDTREAWTQIRIDVLKNRIKVWVNGDLHINKEDGKFPKKGSFYMHTFGTHSQFRNLKIYKLTRWE